MSGSPFDDVENEQPIKQRPDFSISSLLSEGLDGLLSVTGGTAVAALAVISAITAVFAQSLFLKVFQEFMPVIRDPVVADAFEEAIRQNAALGAALDIPIAASGAALLVLPIFIEVVRIATIRAFHANEYSGIPGDLATRRIGWAVLSTFVGGILLAFAVGLGMLALIVPGVIVFIGTLLFQQEVAIADKGIIEAIRGSWGLTKEYRWELLGLMVILFVIGVAVGIARGLVSTILVTATDSLLLDVYVLTPLVNATITVFSIAVITEAYGRLVRLKRGDEVGRDADAGSGDNEWDNSGPDDEWGTA